MKLQQIVSCLGAHEDKLSCVRDGAVPVRAWVTRNSGVTIMEENDFQRRVGHNINVYRGAKRQRQVVGVAVSRKDGQ